MNINPPFACILLYRFTSTPSAIPVNPEIKISSADIKIPFHLEIMFALYYIFIIQQGENYGIKCYTKDISAGAVMFASVTSVFIGLILFGKHLFNLFLDKKNEGEDKYPLWNMR